MVSTRQMATSGGYCNGNGTSASTSSGGSPGSFQLPLGQNNCQSNGGSSGNLESSSFNGLENLINDQHLEDGSMLPSSSSSLSSSLSSSVSGLSSGSLSSSLSSGTQSSSTLSLPAIEQEYPSTSSLSSQHHSSLMQDFKKSDPLNGFLYTNIEPSNLNILDLPIEILMKIFSYMDFKTIGMNREVCQRFNKIGIQLLNSKFTELIKVTNSRFHSIKAMMPRRESARRLHPLACECDIVETCHMRLSLLQMTLGRHIERGHCCFFPGAILDEVLAIFEDIRKSPALTRPYRVTDELFDLSTMAMEYFREHIEPSLPGISNIFKAYFQSSTNTKKPSLVASDLTDNSTNLSSSPPQSNMVLRKGIRKIKEGMKIYNNQLSVLRTELSTCKRKSTEQGKQIAEQQKLLAEQQKQTLEYANRLDENDRKNEEMARKFSTLLQELNKCKTELQYWRSKSPATPICVSCGEKMAPVLPPEDYQALVNQGVKPENLFNLNDDTDAESDVSLNEQNSIMNNEFVFPDENTTNKLLAANMAAKNLKRQYSSTINNLSNSNQITRTASNITNSNTITPIHSNNTKHNERSIASATSSTLSTASNNKTSNEINHKTFKTSTNDTQINSTSNSCNGGESPLSVRSICKESNGVVPQDNKGNNSGVKSLNTNSTYSTKMFYGNQTKPLQQEELEVFCHKSIFSQKSNTLNNEFSPASTSKAAVLQRLCVGAEEALKNVNRNVLSGSNGLASDIKNSVDVTSLQTISAHETKKARRVQKAARCPTNNSSKRSK